MDSERHVVDVIIKTFGYAVCWDRRRRDASRDTDTKTTQVRGGCSLGSGFAGNYSSSDSIKIRAAASTTTSSQSGPRVNSRVTDTTDQELKALWAYVDHDERRSDYLEFQHGCYLLILEGWPLLSKDSLEKIVQS